MLNFSKNYFELFGLPEKFTVDMQLLSQNYLALQQQVHPDRHTSGTTEILRTALQEASLLNEALRTLKDPIARAIYLIELIGITSKTHASSINDADFLLEQMELQEAIANINKQPAPQQAIESIIEQITGYRNTLLQTLSMVLDKNDLLEAQKVVHKLQFLEKSRRSAADVAANLEDNSSILSP